MRLAEEGADIIAIDICRQIDTVTYKMPSAEDLAETAAQVEKLGRRAVTFEADVRDRQALTDAVAAGVKQFGRLDIVLANAGIMFHGLGEGRDDEAYRDAIDVMLIGVWNIIQATRQILIDQGTGGSIVITSSTQGLRGSISGTNGGFFGYASAKHGVVGLMRMMANFLGPHSIRVNSVHPSACDTPMLDGWREASATVEHPHLLLGQHPALPVPLIEPIDVSNAIIYLVSDAGRYVTGTTMQVDAGTLLT